MSDSPSIPESQVASAPAEAETPTVQPAEAATQPTEPAVQPTEPKPSYVKLAMRNMVRKRGTSLFHFALTTVGLIVVLVGLSYLTR
ncbi:DUF3285 domain-containing protein [Leptolyngbya sp. FACHB-671]|uniref:DUF3285 domain-containing protein n=1 Tax=Leptolyngbya sp. FACHB-671 TaxID=2692812 RepID=UPI00168A1107|nr:DUF3285 domain-containing protein [Leptolyngbya sp. FACHB-671]MBD1870991.1 DUF3285 domain-containing protein [Cyanobacteria bacterium FACHB-471]MBD2071863.1 DUF3285 domain-containing protein [Leptolyngbya sp. FACHB-671]